MAIRSRAMQSSRRMGEHFDVASRQELFIEVWKGNRKR